MKKRLSRRMRKMLLMVASMALVLGLAIGGTVAWLFDDSQILTNTFSTGDINIDIAETTSNYKIIPGAKIAKDPKITVADGSEKCYVYVEVENNLKLTDGKLVGTPNIDTSKWTKVGTNGNATVYKYNEIVDAANGAAELTVFTQVSISETEVTKANIGQLTDKTIVVQAYAHQSENTTETVATAAALTFFDATASN